MIQKIMDELEKVYPKDRVKIIVEFSSAWVFMGEKEPREYVYRIVTPAFSHEFKTLKAMSEFVDGFLSELKNQKQDTCFTEKEFMNIWGLN